MSELRKGTIQKLLTEPLFASSVVLSLAAVVLLILILVRLSRGEKVSALRDELQAEREEAGRTARDTRDEISRSLNSVNDSLSKGLTGMASLQHSQLDGMAQQILLTALPGLVRVFRPQSCESARFSLHYSLGVP